ncbi:hypothetical protein ACSQ67_003479 [Phaseolus vulgaris]
MTLSRAVKRAAENLEKRLAEVPKTSMNIVFTLAEVMRFGYAETLGGKCDLFDMHRAILYAIMEKGKKTVAIECKERDDCVQLIDPELLKELYELEKCLTRTMLFSNKHFRAFLFTAGFVKEDVLLRRKAGDDGSKSSSEGSDNDDMDEEEEQIISATHNIANDEFYQYLKELQLEAQNDYPNTSDAKEKEAATKESTTEAEMNDEVVHIEERGGSTAATSDKLVRHHLYPPGRILHIVPVLSTGNGDADEKHVLYETGRELYGKLRLSRGMLFDHMTGKYLKVLQQLINQLEDEKSHYGA